MGSTQSALAKNKTKRSDMSKRQLKSSLQMLTFALPAIVWFIIFSYIPMLGLSIAFQKYEFRKGIFGSSFIGFDNFKYLFQSLDLVRILRNTILYNCAFILLTMIAAIAVALMLNSLKKRWQVKIFQTSFFLPYFVSWVVIGYIASTLFDYRSGILNQMLTFIGKEPVSWYQEPKHWIWLLPTFSVWKALGYQSVVYLGAILGVDSEILEAATIDGCSGLQKIRYITLPLITPTIVILLLMSIGSILRADFGLFYYIPNNSGMLYSTTDVIDTYLFRALTQLGNVSVSSAVGFFQSVVGFILVIVSNKLVNKYNSDYALF